MRGQRRVRLLHGLLQQPGPSQSSCRALAILGKAQADVTQISYPIQEMDTHQNGEEERGRRGMATSTTTAEWAPKPKVNGLHPRWMPLIHDGNELCSQPTWGQIQAQLCKLGLTGYSTLGTSISSVKWDKNRAELDRLR